MVRLDSVTNIDADEISGHYNYTYSCTIVAKQTRKLVSTEYSQGDTLYDTITVDDEVLPEEGTLIDGSATGSYCVLKIGGNYYYYVREE